MQDTSQIVNYAEIVRGTYSVEWAIDIGENGRLITRGGEYITFGSGDGLTRILISAAGADSGFGEDYLMGLTITNNLFDRSPTVGKCVAAEIDVELRMPEMVIPRMAVIRAYCRVRNETLISGWLNMGTFYTDTREHAQNLYGDDTIKLHGFDAMLTAEQAYVWGLSAGATDIQVVGDIASQLQWTVDSRTSEIMTQGYRIMTEQVGQYTMREMLGYLAAMYCGSFIITPNNELRLVQLISVPAETSYLSVMDGAAVYHLTFGSGDGLVKILV